MVVVLKKVVLQNFLSYGNTETVIEFTDGLNLVTGPNGVGKSSLLLDAISFAWFNKPYRKINKNELINRKNKKNTKVECHYEINNVPYIVKRGLKNKDIDLEVWINNIKQDLLPSQSLNQAEIEKHLGIDYKLFKQIISLSINFNAPFLTLPAGEKRELLEKFFNIDTIAIMLKKSKDLLKERKTRRDMMIHSVDMLSEFLKTEKLRIKKLSASKKTFDADKQKEIDDINHSISELKKQLKTCKKDGKSKTDEMKSIKIPYNLDELNNDIQKHNELKYNATYDITNARKIINSLDEHDVCPMCMSNLTEEHKLNEVDRQQNIINESNNIIKKENDILLELNSHIEEVNDINKRIESLKYEIRDLKKTCKSLSVQISSLEGELSKVSDRKFAVDLKEMKREYKSKLAEYTDSKEDISNIDRDIKKYNKIIEILSDSGVKSYIFDQLIPVLNKSINYYLNIFDLPVYIEFDNSMKDNIKTTSNFNSQVSYMSFSEGEKKKIDIAILLSFIDVTKKIANWNCNLLIVDELLDSSIDDDGLSKLLDSLITMIEGDENLGIYIISHKISSDYNSMFNTIVDISKDNSGFSKIVTHRRDNNGNLRRQNRIS